MGRGGGVRGPCAMRRVDIGAQCAPRVQSAPDYSDCLTKCATQWFDLYLPESASRSPPAVSRFSSEALVSTG